MIYSRANKNRSWESLPNWAIALRRAESQCLMSGAVPRKDGSAKERDRDGPPIPEEDQLLEESHQQLTYLASKGIAF